MSCVHSIILACQQALERILNTTNTRGKSVKDVAMSRANCIDLLEKFGATNVAPPPPQDEKQPEGRIWKRRK